MGDSGRNQVTATHELESRTQHMQIMNQNIQAIGYYTGQSNEVKDETEIEQTQVVCFRTKKKKNAYFTIYCNALSGLQLDFDSTYIL